MHLFHAPQPIADTGEPTLFLAGSIDLGKAENWQDIVVQYFTNSPVTIFNPRRPDWDNSWKQSSDDPQFLEQVTWELDALERADVILMNLLPGSQSPISLLELGLFAHSAKLRVCCPTEFWRAGNVEVVCDRFQIPLYRSLPELLHDLPYKP